MTPSCLYSRSCASPSRYSIVRPSGSKESISNHVMLVVLQRYVSTRHPIVNNYARKGKDENSPTNSSWEGPRCRPTFAI